MNLINYSLLLIVVSIKKTALNLELLGNKMSHDQITRALNKDLFWQILLEEIFKPFKINHGYLIIDDTSIEKAYGKAFQGAGWVYSGAKGKSVYGYQVVLLIWTDGIRRLIIDYKIYKKGGKSKIILALELLSYARNRLRIKPEFVLFDSWYSAKKILKRISDYGWYFVTRIKKNRSLDGIQLKKFRNIPYWKAKGILSGGLKVFIIKNNKKYFATNRLSLSRTEVFKHYKLRQHIEEINKQLKYIGLQDCQVRSEKAQHNHVGACSLAYSLLEKESRENNMTLYKAKNIAIYKGYNPPKYLLERLMKVA